MSVRNPYALDRLIEHMLAATERAVVRFEVDRFAVARPHVLVYPGVVHAEGTHRAAASRHYRETARSHDVGFAVSRSERQPLTVGRVPRTVVDSRAVNDHA